LESDFSTNRFRILDALDNIYVPSKRSSGILTGILGEDPLTGLGIDLALRSLRTSAHPKKALLVISNRFKGLGPVLVERVRESGGTLLTLGFKMNKAETINRGWDWIYRKQLMRESGGRKFSAETEDINGVSRSIVTSLKNYYSIGYQTEIKPNDKKLRRIEVQVPGHKYTINARRGYLPNS
jgi:hypothetical protein